MKRTPGRTEAVGGAPPSSAEGAAPARQRLDKWLWFARAVRTRAAAADLARSGRVRVNGQRATDASRAVRIGDVLTVALGERVLVWKIAGLGEQRDAYPQARQLYEDLAPPRDSAVSSGLRASGKDASNPAERVGSQSARHRDSVAGRTRETDQ